MHEALYVPGLEHVFFGGCCGFFLSFFLFRFFIFTFPALEAWVFTITTMKAQGWPSINQEENL